MGYSGNEGTAIQFSGSTSYEYDKTALSNNMANSPNIAIGHQALCNNTTKFMTNTVIGNCALAPHSCNMIFTIPVDTIPEDEIEEYVKSIAKRFKEQPMSDADYYLQVNRNSHFWTDLNQLINAFELQSEMLTKEYLLIGLNNTVKNGYKLKPTFKEDIKVKSGNPIFASVEQMIEYVNDDCFNKNVFYVMLVATIAAEINLTNGRKMERTDIYKCIDGERDYQDANWGSRRQADGTPDEEKPVAEWINYIEYHISKAKDKVYHLDTAGATAELRKVAALAVRAMEIHGCPERQKESHGTPIQRVYEMGSDKPCCDGNCSCKQ